MRAAALLALLLLPTAAAEFGAYDDRGWPLNVLGESTFPGGALPGAALPDGPVNTAGPLTVYPYYPVLTAEVTRLARDHADLVKLHSAGKSTAGLDLWMLEIADFGNPDMRPLEEREVVWLDGGTHSNEYSGVYFAAHVASFLADEYATNDTARWIVENRHTWIMPMVNPDGSHAFGRLNAKLVNVNRNYPVDWGALAEDPILNNPGEAPASEVETRVNIEWFNKTRPDLYASIHCCGNLWLYPYGVEGLDPPDNATFARVCAEAFPTVVEDCGPIWSTIYPASGSSVDTVYEYTGAVAFGYEMSGRGAVALWGQPFTDKSVREQEVESWNGFLHGMLNVERYGAHLVVASAGADGATLTLLVRNDGYGNLTAGNVTFTDPAGVATAAPLPFIPAGGEATVRVPGALSVGDARLGLSYAKRVLASPERAIDLPVRIGRAGDTFGVVVGDEAIALQAAPEPLAVPALAPLLAVGAALAVAALRRR